MLRSESYSLLTVPKATQQSFRAPAPRLSNKLTNQIKLAASKEIFRKVLKIHLFKLAYLKYGDQFIMYKTCLCCVCSEYVLIMF